MFDNGIKNYQFSTSEAKKVQFIFEFSTRLPMQCIIPFPYTHFSRNRFFLFVWRILQMLDKAVYISVDADVDELNGRNSWILNELNLRIRNNSYK